MVGLLTMAGSTSLVGIWLYRHWGNKKPAQPNQGKMAANRQAASARPQDQVGSSQQTGASPKPMTTAVANPPSVTLPANSADQGSPRYGLHTATLALGVTTVGWVVSPPLQVAGLPLLVYMGIPAAQQAYQELLAERHSGRALVETVALTVCLASGAYWVGALGFWLYYGSQHWLAGKPPDKPAQSAQPLAPTTTHLWKDGAACAVPTATLQPGDQVILHSGELAPMDGLITEGVAWLRPHVLSSAVGGLRKSAGDKVAATDLVVVGRICVRVLPTAC